MPVSHVAQHQYGESLTMLTVESNCNKQMNWTPVPDHENSMEVNEAGEVRIKCYGLIRLTVLPGEEWKPLRGYDRNYDVSNLGRVRTMLDSRSRIKIVKQYGTGRDRVHLSVNLRLNGKQITRLVHHLVAQVWLPPKPAGLIILHGSGGRRDNRPDNLSYGTYKQNAGPDRERDGTLIRGEESCWAKLTEQNVIKIRKSNETCRSLAERYSVCAMTISSARTGKSWKHVD